MDELLEMEMFMEHHESDLRAHTKEVRSEISILEDHLNKHIERVQQYEQMVWEDMKSLFKERGLI